MKKIILISAFVISACVNNQHQQQEVEAKVVGYSNGHVVVFYMGRNIATTLTSELPVGTKVTGYADDLNNFWTVKQNRFY